MHIVFVDTTLTTAPTGGAQTFLVALAGALATKDWKISVVTQMGSEAAIVESLRSSGVEVIDDLWNAVQLPEERASNLSEWVNSQRPAAYVVSISPDAGWLALPALDPSIATLSIAHNDVSAFFEPVSHYRALLDCAIGVSEEIHRKIVAECGVPPGRARHIPYGIEPLTPNEFTARCETSQAASPLRIGYVGRLEQPQKRILDFVPLVVELERRKVAFELHLIGDGNDRTRLEDELKRLAPDAPVKFHGWLSPEEVRKQLSELDAFLLMSDFEGLPVALLEAMGNGLAPVVSEIASGNVQLVKDGENGFSAPPGDIPAFAERLARLARDYSLLCSIKKSAWETSLDYSVERMVERYISCLSHVTGAEFSREHRRNAPAPYPVMQSCKSSYPMWMRKLKRRLLTPRDTAVPVRSNAS